MLIGSAAMAGGVRRQRIVVKYGGNAMVDDHLKAVLRRYSMVFSASGGSAPDCRTAAAADFHMLKALGIKSEFKGGLRVTTPRPWMWCAWF